MIKQFILSATVLFVLPYFSNEKINLTMIDGEDPTSFLTQASNASCVKILDGDTSFSSDSQDFHFQGSHVNQMKTEGDAGVLHYRVANNMAECRLNDFPDCGSQTFLFFYDNSFIDQVTLYFAKDASGVIYTSTLSMDNAKRLAGLPLPYNLVDTSKITAEKVADSNGARKIGAQGEVSGTFLWTDTKDQTHPLVGAKIHFTMEGSWWSADTMTDKNGHYQIGYSDVWHWGYGKLHLSLYSDGNLVGVKHANGDFYEHAYTFSSGSGKQQYSHTFSVDSDGDMGRAMMVFQAGVNFSSFADQMDATDMTYCSIYYPCNDSEKYGPAYYQNNGIYLTGKNYRLSPVQSYASWDVIGHEYGHHVQHVYGISNNVGGEHEIGKNLIDVLAKSSKYQGNSQKAKEDGMKLAWNEAWPTFWSTEAQTHFTSDVKTVPWVGDTAFLAFNYVSYDLNEYDPAASFGDADERAIQRILFKLVSPEQDQYDKFSIPFATLWNLAKTQKPKTFSEFVAALYQTGIDKKNFGLLLGQYRVVADTITVTKQWSEENPPSFTWSTFSGSTYFPFNQFDLCFEVGGTLVHKAVNLNATGNTITYTPSEQIWKKIYTYNWKYLLIQFYFVARQASAPSSGDYYSQAFSMTALPSNINVTERVL